MLPGDANTNTCKLSTLYTSVTQTCSVIASKKSKAKTKESRKCTSAIATTDSDVTSSATTSVDSGALSIFFYLRAVLRTDLIFLAPKERRKSTAARAGASSVDEVNIDCM